MRTGFKSSRGHFARSRRVSSAGQSVCLRSRGPEVRILHVARCGKHDAFVAQRTEPGPPKTWEPRFESWRGHQGLSEARRQVGGAGSSPAPQGLYRVRPAPALSAPGIRGAGRSLARGSHNGRAPTARLRSSAGRAPPRHGGGRWFDPSRGHAMPPSTSGRSHPPFKRACESTIAGSNPAGGT
jgi:hypothetical protein